MSLREWVLSGNSDSEVTKTRTTSIGCMVSKGTPPTKGVFTSPPFSALGVAPDGSI